MKFIVAFVAVVAVAVALPTKPTLNDIAYLEAMVTAINSPNTDPATAVLLQEQLAQLLDLTPISVGPAIVEPIVHPISVGPAIVEPIVHPIAVGPAIVEPIGNPVDVIAVNPMPVIEPVAPAPVAESAASPLVQIIVNVQKAEDVASGVAPSPVVMPSPAPVVEEVYVPGPVNVAESADISPVAPVQVANPVIVEPIHVGTPVLPTPVEPVQVGTPIIPEMAVNPIETLN